MALPSFDTSLRILALYAVHNKKDWEAAYRRICRWYSREFSTPLHTVFDLDESFVLQHYYEHAYHSMEDAEWRQEVLEAVETKEERDQRLRDEANADIDLLRKATADRERLESRRARQPQTMGGSSDDLRQEFEAAANKLKSALDGLPAAIVPAKRQGEKIKAAPAHQINLPGFAVDSFVRLSETDPAPIEEEPVGSAPARAPMKRSRTK